jgi:hypothetical protein
MTARRHRSVGPRWLLFFMGLLSAMMPWTEPALGLEKYGRPLPSMDEPEHEAREEEETLFGGYLLTGAFVKNPTFAARPDNTGLVGMRHMLHLETDLYKQYLTFYTDQNFFSDRTDGWIKLTEWDGTFAFTGVLDRFNWRLQYERDAPLDRRGLKQAYADALVTARFQAIQDSTWWRRTFPNQNLTAYAGAGWLFHNSQYFARPNNTGRALFRYVAPCRPGRLQKQGRPVRGYESLHRPRSEQHPEPFRTRLDHRHRRPMEGYGIGLLPRRRPTAGPVRLGPKVLRSPNCASRSMCRKARWNGWD